MSHYGAEACKDSKSLQATKLRLLKKFSKPNGARLLLRALEVNLNTVEKTLVSPNSTRLLSQGIPITKSWKRADDCFPDKKTRNNQSIIDNNRSIETALALNSPMRTLNSPIATKK